MNKDDNIIQSILKGPSLGYTDNFPKRQMWEDVAKEVNGEFKIRHNSGHELEIHILKVPYNKREIKLSVSDSRPLKVEISFESNINYKLTLSWEGLIERILKKFSKPEIELGWSDFDKHYLIRSNSADLTKKVMTKEIQNILLKHNIYSISYATDKKNKTAALISVIQRKAGSKDKILELIEMYKSLIDNFEKAKIIR